MFTKASEGMGYGRHIDNAYMTSGRADLSFTIFLSTENEYEGGELFIENLNSENKFKLNSGEIIIYPSTYLHSVEEVIDGHYKDQTYKLGEDEQELKEMNADFKVGQFPIRALGRARASMDIQGVIKIISDSKSDEVLGVHMIAPRAADLIMEAVVAMEYRASAEDIARICHPHPTYSEAVKEAALAATENRPLHI